MNKQDQNNKSTTVPESSHCPLLAAVIAVTLACGCSAEHPSEHPGSAAKSTVKLSDVSQSVESYVKQESKDGGFKIKDPLTGKELSLSLDRVHSERLSQVGPGMFFVCADFEAADGTLYDLDFFVQGKSKDSLLVLPARISIHKVNGKERYTWAFNAQKSVWEQKPIGAKTTKPPVSEHP